MVLNAGCIWQQIFDKVDMAGIQILNLKQDRHDLVFECLVLSMRVIDIDKLPVQERNSMPKRVMRALLVHRIKEIDDQIDLIDEQIEELSQ